MPLPKVGTGLPPEDIGVSVIEWTEHCRNAGLGLEGSFHSGDANLIVTKTIGVGRYTPVHLFRRSDDLIIIAAP